MDISSIISDSTKKVPRPLNCFMTYRLEKQQEILQRCPGTNHRDISKITAKWWKEMTAAEKEPYRLSAHSAKLEHEKMYPNYKFNPKKKITKTRAYKKRTEDAFTAQDFEQQQKLSVLYNEGMKAKLSSNPVIEYHATLIPENDFKDICCSDCFSSSAPSRTCFSKTSSENLHPIPSQSVSPYPSSLYTALGYYGDPNNLNYSQLFPPHHYYGSAHSQKQTYSPYASTYRMPSIRQPYTIHDTQAPALPPPTEYYSETKDVNINGGNRNFHSLIHSGYTHSPFPTVISPPTFYYHQ